MTEVIDRFYDKERFFKEHPSYKNLLENTLIINSNEDFNYYFKENMIKVKVYDEYQEISLNLIKDIISDEGLFNEVNENFNYNGTECIYITNFNDGNPFIASVSKACLAKALKMDLSSIFGKKPSPIQSIRMEIINRQTNDNALDNRYVGTYTCLIGNKECSCPASDLVQIVKHKETLNNLIDGKIKNLYGLSIKQIMYMIVDFFEREEIFSKFALNDEQYQRYQDIKNYKIVDFQSINAFNSSNAESNSQTIDNIRLNDELVNAVKVNMPSEYSDLEKALYIYVRLCDILTYDDEYYASGLINELTGVHEDINNISNITPTNNKIVSYEFAIIYAKLLSGLDIKYNANLNSLAGESNSNSYLEFTSHDYLVSVDLFNEGIKNDLYNVKTGEKLTSIKCYNQNELTRKIFEDTLDLIYKRYTDRQERQKQFNMVIDEYKTKYMSDINIPMRNKLYILFKLLFRKDLKGMDSVNYIQSIFDIVCGQNDSVRLTIAATKVDGRIGPVIIVSLFDNNNYTYFICNPNDTSFVESINKEEFLKRINNNEVMYLATSSPIIGITEGGIDEGDENIEKTKRTGK